jgi:hypothetical protein
LLFTLSGLKKTTQSDAKQTTITQNVAGVLTANEAAEYYCRSRESDKNNKQKSRNNEILLSHDFIGVCSWHELWKGMVGWDASILCLVL